MEATTLDSASELRAILDSFTPAPPLSTRALEGSFWRLFDLHGRVISPFLVLAPDGLIGNCESASAQVWHIVNGQLCLTGDGGIPSVIFKIARGDAGHITTLAGEGTVDGRDAVYLLHRVEHPAHPLYATPPETPRRAAFLKQPPKDARRPNLVVVPAGANSLHPHWLEGDAPRNWDLCIGYYGRETPHITTPHDYLAHIPQTKKFRLLYDLFYAGSPLWDYDNIWLPDDDLLTNGASINQMFHLFRRAALDLAQPAMLEGPGCYPNHPLTAQQKGSTLRHTQFVEIMCPVFSVRALRIAIGTMRDTDSGYGLDHLWPALLGHPLGRIGIIDATPVAHTRPIGATYDIRAAIGEQHAIHAAYAHTMRSIPGVR